VNCDENAEALPFADDSLALVVNQESPLILKIDCDGQNRTLKDVDTLIASIVLVSVLQCTEENVDRRNYRVEFAKGREAFGLEQV
jgi:hypothetical protein